MYVIKVSGLLISMLALSTVLSAKQSDQASVPTEFCSIGEEKFSLANLSTESYFIAEQRCSTADMPVGVYRNA